MPDILAISRPPDEPIESKAVRTLPVLDGIQGGEICG
jgi:hypothetical protein